MPHVWDDDGNYDTLLCAENVLHVSKDYSLFLATYEYTKRNDVYAKKEN